MMLARGFLFAALLLAPSAADARTELAGTLNLYVSTTGTDAPGCGTYSAGPCRTREYLWNELRDNYDLRCKHVDLWMQNPPFTDGLYGQGNPPGTCTKHQISPVGGVPLSQTQQIVWHGDDTDPHNFVIRPARGPAFFPENGAHYCIQGVTLDGSSFPWESLTGATKGSGLCISGPVVFGCAPGMVEVQPGADSSFFVFSSYEIDHTICGPPGASPYSENAAVVSGSNQLGSGGPVTPINVGDFISMACVPTGTKVVSISGFYVTMSKPATCSAGLAAVVFAPFATGCSLFHVQQDAYSYGFYETDTALTGHITVNRKNTPCYNTFMSLDNAKMILDEGPAHPATTFKGPISGIETSVIMGGYIFNGGPNDNHIVYTP